MFSTEPHQVSNMIDGTFTMPHPTNTDCLKHLGTVKDYGPKSCGFLFRWWSGETYIPSRMLRKLKSKGVIDKSTIYAWHDKYDHHSKYNQYMFDRSAGLMKFTKYMQELQGEKVIFDPCTYSTYGRNGVEMSCLGKPVVGSNRVWSYNKLMPELTVDPYDYRDVEKKFKFVMDNPEEVKAIMDKAYKEVEWFNYSNSLKRWKDACKISFERGGHEWYQKQI